MALVLPGYRQFRRPPGLLAIARRRGGNRRLGRSLSTIGPDGADGLARSIARLRPASGASIPLGQLAAAPAWAWTFLAIRFFGLVLVVPVIEEFFLRGFLMRLVVDQDWWKVPFGKVNAAAVAVSIVVPMLWHQPGEFLAAAAWFGMVTWLMVRTRNPWDCVLAHAVTNLLLGIYVVTRHQWALW